MIEELAKNHAQWIKIALSISGGRDLSNDLVQDMYLKLHDCTKEINSSYVYCTIKSIYLNGKKKNSKEIPVDIFYDVSDDDDIIDDRGNISDDNDFLITKQVFDSFKTYEQIIIRESYEEGLRQFSRKSQICTWFISNLRKKFKQKVWEEAKKQDSATLSPQSQKQLELNLAKVVHRGGLFLT